MFNRFRLHRYLANNCRIASVEGGKVRPKVELECVAGKTRSECRDERLIAEFGSRRSFLVAWDGIGHGKAHKVLLSNW